MSTDLRLFLDSGAFSAFTKGVQIDIPTYCDFIKQHKDYLSVYSVLDVIGDAEGTWQNQLEMERQGVTPLPCFHYGEDVKYLHRYMDKYDYIALGGMVPVSTGDLVPWLDSVFTNHICGPDGLPRVKVHGFGMTSLRLMIRYPWYSVDSTSWVMSSRMGTVYVPRRRNGEYQYLEEAWKVAISSRSPKTSEAGTHFTNFPKAQQRVILDYFEEKGLPVGKSEYRTVDANYELQEGERWHGKAVKGKRELEVRLEEGLANNYWFRDQANLGYFLDLQDALPAWPWKFSVPTVRKGFF